MRSFVVIGCGRFGSSVATNLYELGNEVMVIDSSEEIVNEISSSVTHAVQANVMDESVLEDLGLSNFDVAIIAIGSELEASVMATLAAKELGIKKVIAKAQSKFHSKILKKIGADKVIFPEQDMGRKVAHNLNSTNIFDVIEFSPEYSIVEMKVIDDWAGKSLYDLNLRSEYHVTVIAIRRDEEVDVSPSALDTLTDEDILVIIGNVEDVEKLEKIVGEK